MQDCKPPMAFGITIWRLACFLGLVGLLAGGLAYAQQEEDPNALHEYLSLRHDKVRMRTAPGTSRPVLWLYQRRGLPLLVTRRVEHWRRVQDWEGEQGWVHISQLSRQRTAVVAMEEIALYSEPEASSPRRAILAYGMVGVLAQCLPEWCQMRVENKAQKIEGWVHRGGIWGIGADELIK